MAFLAKGTPYLNLLAGLLVVGVSTSAADQEAALSMQAVIANKGLSCDLILPETTLQFKPLSVAQLTGAVQTYQISPLHLQLKCDDETESILPTLSVEGITPYTSDIGQAVFLSGTPNGVGFMLRQSDDGSSIALADFYQPALAISNGGQGKALQVLDASNLYYSDQVLWVGLVGPFQPDIVPGHFHASLTLNVAFE